MGCDLKSLLTGNGILPPGADGLAITGITADSREVTPGTLFAALTGSTTDGMRFIPDAVAKGAVAILCAVSTDPVESSVPVVYAEDPRRALAIAASRFFAAQPEFTVAVTGTSGKSSVVDFTRQVFTTLGLEAASLGTLGVGRASGTTYGALTTPDPVALHRMLAELSREGITHLAFEASSHGLDQRRLDGVKIAAGAFTNLGHDHLDYHLNTEDYLRAKLRLFDTLMEPRQPVVICADGARSADVISACNEQGLRVLTVGETGTDLRLHSVTRHGAGQRIEVAHGRETQTIELPLIGTYQATNALVAAGLAIALGAEANAAIAALSGLKGVDGRLQIIGERNGGTAVVDYAHKPDALEAALTALRPIAFHRLICVVGCGGDRDHQKRPVMGRIASDLADRVIITDDNPRTENPAEIRREILAGTRHAEEIGDRAEAIAAAIADLGPGDVALIAGKGHETGQIVGDKVHEFSDQAVVREALTR